MSVSNTTMPSSRPGTVFCILCNGLVSYKKGDSKRFEDHMNIEHGAFYNLDYILAGCLMSKDERQVITELFEEKQMSSSGNDNNEGGENVKELSILDRAFPLVNTAATSDVAVVLAKAKSESFVSKMDDSRVNCELCESRISKKNISRHLIKVHKLGKEERIAILRSLNRKIKDEIPVSGDSRNPKIGDSHNFTENPTDESNEVDNMCQDNTNNDEVFNDNLEDEILNEINNDAVSSISGDQLKETTLNCDLCEYSSAKESNLKTHKTLKHKSKEKLHEKLIVSNSLFKKSTRSSDEEGREKACNKCDYIAYNSKDFRRHRFQNHIHDELMRKGVKVEEEDLMDSENLLIEGPAKSLDLNDVSMEIEDSVLDSSHKEPIGNVGFSKSKLSKEEYQRRKAVIVEKSEYFGKCSNNIQSWSGSEDDLVPAESFLPSFGVKNCVTSSGRKYSEFVTPNRHFKLRSLVAVLEYMKISEEFTEEDVRTLEVKLKAKTL